MSRHHSRFAFILFLMLLSGTASAQYEGQFIGKSKKHIINTFGMNYDAYANEITYWRPNQFSERYVFRFQGGKCNEIVIYYNSCSYGEAKSQFEWLLGNYIKFGWFEKNFDPYNAYWRRLCDKNFSSCATIMVASSGNGGVIFQVVSITN